MAAIFAVIRMCLTSESIWIAGFALYRVVGIFDCFVFVLAFVPRSGRIDEEFGLSCRMLNTPLH